MMRYKGYFGKVVYDNELKILHGEIIGLKDVITFQGTLTKEIEQAFKDSVNDYLNWCKDRGENPEKTYSGNIRIRIPQKLHEKLVRCAAVHGMSLNSLIIDQLQKDIK